MGPSRCDCPHAVARGRPGEQPLDLYPGGVGHACSPSLAPCRAARGGTGRAILGLVEICPAEPEGGVGGKGGAVSCEEARLSQVAVGETEGPHACGFLDAQPVQATKPQNFQGTRATGTCSCAEPWGRPKVLGSPVLPVTRILSGRWRSQPAATGGLPHPPLAPRVREAHVSCRRTDRRKGRAGVWRYPAPGLGT